MLANNQVCATLVKICPLGKMLNVAWRTGGDLIGLMPGCSPRNALVQTGLTENIPYANSRAIKHPMVWSNCLVWSRRHHTLLRKRDTEKFRFWPISAMDARLVS